MLLSPAFPWPNIWRRRQRRTSIQSNTAADFAFRIFRDTNRPLVFPDFIAQIRNPVPKTFRVFVFLLVNSFISCLPPRR